MAASTHPKLPKNSALSSESVRSALELVLSSMRSPEAALPGFLRVVVERALAAK